jgi:ribosomal protein S18 acetylase RimI-like enzyme
MKKKHNFRSLRDDDLPELERMILALYQEDPPGQTMSLEKIRRTVQELSAHPEKGDIALALAGDLVVGYAIVIRYWSNEYGGDIACIDELYVKPDWRGLGIGASCLDHIAGSGDYRALLLETTPANRRAREFYIRKGFGPMSNRRLFKRLFPDKAQRP